MLTTSDLSALPSATRTTLGRGKRVVTRRAHTGPFSTGSREKIQRFVLPVPHCQYSLPLVLVLLSSTPELQPMTDARSSRSLIRPNLSRALLMRLAFACGSIAPVHNGAP